MFDPANYPNLLVGLDGPDDAAVWKISDEQAIVITTDFFTPVVDTPFEYGSVAAANSLSDVFAMGGTPFLALNIAAFPPSLPPEMLSDVLKGGAEKCKEAGVVVAGGHTIQDTEPKFGLVVLGFVHPKKLIQKAGAKPGDQLFLTKPLGVGTMTTALKRGLLTEFQTESVIKSMAALNAKSGKLAVNAGVKSGTDITGFGLLGHGLEMAGGSGVRFELDFSKIPFLPGAEDHAKQWVFPGGSADNKLFYGNRVAFHDDIADWQQMLLFDAQTSGGLLLAVPSEKVVDFEKEAKELGQDVWNIGRVVAGDGISVR